MKRPNILFINLDQQRYDSLGFTGNAIVKTPQIDRLASQGMSFSSAYTPIALCCPARQTLMSGVMPEVHGGLWNYDLANSMKALKSSECESWVDSLKASGYRTAYIGKWHVSPKEDPTAFGYETYQSDTCVPEAHRVSRYPIENPGLSFDVGCFDDRPVEDSPTHVSAEACIQKIKTFSEGDAPWHVRVDFPEPHLPCLPCEPFASMYCPEDLPPWPNFEDSLKGKPFIQRQQLKNWQIEDWTWKEWSVYLWGYYGIISQVDDAIGKIVDFVEASGLSEDTLIIYTTDHGDAAGSHRMMDKHYVMYEEEVHVPMLLQWKGTIEAGSTCDDFVSHFLDLPVTLLDLLGFDKPSSYQGQSFLPQLCGKANENARGEIFSTYHGQQFGLYTQRMLRDRNYKFVWNATDVDELYDMNADPYELENLAEDPASSTLLKDYRKRLADLFDGLGDGMMKNAWMSGALRN